MVICLFNYFRVFGVADISVFPLESTFNSLNDIKIELL